jgi:tetratricopeptide (TPR) repeat protein
VKYRKASLLAVLALGLAIASGLVLRAGGSPTPPAPWMVTAATALSRDPLFAAGHGRAPRAADARVARDAMLEGQRLRVERRFAEAAEAFRVVVAANPANADAWADLADCLAAATGRDLAAGRDAIERALAIEPHHLKALWLRASLELQEKRYVEAAASWRQLEALVPPGSGDARIIAANVAEADALARAATLAGGPGN